MTSAFPRLVLGVVLMGGACLIALRYGDRTTRMAAVLIGACWTLTTAAQVATGLRAEPVIVGDIVCGLGLLGLAASFNTGWLWFMTLIEAAMFVLHAWFYGASERPGEGWIWFNNGLATVVLATLVWAALRPRETSGPGRRSRVSRREASSR